MRELTARGVRTSISTRSYQIKINGWKNGPGISKPVAYDVCDGWWEGEEIIFIWKYIMKYLITDV